MDDYVRRLCACGYTEAFSRHICLEFIQELGRDWLNEYVSEIESNLEKHYVAALQS